MQCQNQKAKNKNAEGTKGKNSKLALPNSEKKLAICLQGESPIALPSLRRRSTDEQNLRLRAQNQGSALRARGLPGHNRLDRAHAVRRAVDAGRDDARVCRDGEPRAEGARTARRREGRGSRSWSSCFDVVWRVVCCCARARARRQATLARRESLVVRASSVRPSGGFVPVPTCVFCVKISEH